MFGKPTLPFGVALALRRGVQRTKQRSAGETQRSGQQPGMPLDDAALENSP